MTSQNIFLRLPGCHGNQICHQNDVMIIAIYITKGTTNLYITLSFELHIGLDICPSEMNAKFENIL